MDLDDIIEFDEEGTNLDFKKEEYRKESYSSLIKDVMSMANVINTENKRIIIGVKHKPGEDRIIEGLDTISDQATFENIIQDNIEPNINFRYFTYKFQGKMLGILEISDNIDKPYMMKKDYGVLKKGDMWIRKGSRQSKVTREDLDKMFSMRKKSVFENKVIIGFGKDLLKEITLSKESITRECFPSMIRKKELQVLLHRLDDRYNKKQDIPPKNNTMDTSLQKSLKEFTSFGLFSEFNDKDKSIRVGYDSMNFPVYCNREKLVEKINNVSKAYYDKDCYYLYEENSSKINFYIFNDGTEFLEDVVIDLYFDSEVFMVSEEIYEKPEPISIYNLNFNVPNSNSRYPSVRKDDKNIVVQEEHKQIRHKTFTKLFFDELRVLINQRVESKKSEIKYVISAKNLPNCIEGIITVNIR